MSWIVLDKLSESPTWDECYATHDTDSRCPDDASVITLKSDSDEKHPVELKDEGCFSVPSPPNSSFPTPAPSSSPPHKDLQTSSISQNQWRDIGATASHRNKVREHRGFRAPVFMQRRCGGCCCCNCSQRRSRPWRSRPWRSRQRRFRQRRPKPTRFTPVTSWQHLPVTIQPTKWYQVVGRMRCSLCYAQGWHYMTSWMCQSCQVPLCLLPYRNCYAEWHGQTC
ncbi:uncharacterized protein LOC116697131 [Etheostoma spectabile]|uniref:uncharacterized protein LOC116697131 n=1 Tax=Etheostoma spectabile TaxID=54343 RepID=UPI0013AE9C74|nr:uncharacterized protein LOC116697131 [Etheostoma spectabile]